MNSLSSLGKGLGLRSSRRMVHGSSEAVIGDFGGRYGSMIPDISAALQMLLSLQPRQARAWPSEPSI